MSNEEQLRQLQALQEAVRQAKLSLQPAQLQAAVRALAQLPLTGAEDIRTGLQQALATLPHEVTPQQFTQICDLCLELMDLADSRLQATPARKKVMVFLPYKASMWDSLESIWQAASADKEHCEAIVMPIPYCDLTPERQVKEWHYEGPLFPPYVPITHYDSLDLARLHPDIIFIHNPYDNYNRVTSIDSRFYSSELKQYTAKLIYVPYFVIGDTVAEHFVQTPGVVNADYVIVQDENIKAQYEQFYPGGNPPPGKILGLGSPKFDSVLRRKKSDYVLPAEWQRLIGDKKIILYNTSLSTQLGNPKHAIGKLRQVLQYFRMRSDMALWWRPHPLMEATLRSMLPELTSEYCQLRDAYIREGWGIYDDTPDMDRAMVCSDAYYGDMSSMIWLYRSLGKPILLEKLVQRRHEELSLETGHIWRDGSTVYFLPFNTMPGFCGLFQLDTVTDQVRFLCSIPRRGRSEFPYKALGKTGSKIIVAPCRGHTVFWEYDLTTGSLTEHPCEAMAKALSAGDVATCANVVCWQERLYCIGNATGVIAVYDPQSASFTYHTAWSEQLQRQGLDLKDLNFAEHGYVQVENLLYLVVQRTNWVLRLNLEDFSVTCWQMPFAYAALTLAVEDRAKGILLVVPRTGNDLVRWDTHQGRFSRVQYRDAFLSSFAITNFIRVGDKMLGLPCLGNHVAVLEAGGQAVGVNPSIDWMIGDYAGTGMEKFAFAITENDGRHAWAVRRCDNLLMEIDCQTGQLKKHKLRYQGDVPDAEIQKLDMREGAILTLDKMLALAASRQDGQVTYQDAGTNIYHWLQRLA